MSGRTLVTGGCGFIGTNLVARLTGQGREVVVLDNLSRAGVASNRAWLQHRRGPKVQLVDGDVRDPVAVARVLDGVDQVFHFAAQVAVTTSVADPQFDFSVNLGGTVNLLEQLRRLDDPPPLLFTSTNKVYGDLDDLTVRRSGDRHEPVDQAWVDHGIGEDRPLRFCSPYGCSKGGADQYVLDYAKTYGLANIVFRMSCIYGPHQQGNEDQGWVAHFVKQALSGQPITLYGDGGQVRDILFVEDLLDAMALAMGDPQRLAGQAFNMGGGPDNAVSLLELLDVVASSLGRRARIDFGPWRVGDQRWYVSDTRRFQELTGWSTRWGVKEGLEQLTDWLRGLEHPLVAEAG